MLHHVVTLIINLVLFVVGTGRSITKGRILYVCLLDFAQYLRHGYTYAMKCVRVSSFAYIGRNEKQIPPEYDELLRHSHASDMYTFSYFNLSRVIRKGVLTAVNQYPHAT